MNNSVSDSQHVVEILDVTVTHNGMMVLDSVSFTVGNGEFAAVIGPNGAGKTTLIRAVLGLITPDSGIIRVFGHTLDEIGPMRSKIGYVPQIFAIDLSFPVTVFEAVLMGTYGRLGVGKRPGPNERAAAEAALHKVGIEELRDRPIGRLSSGQRQRAFIARALANDPQLLVLDEPTTGVDVATTGSLYTLLKELKDQGVTILLVSHDVSVVASFVDRVACLNRSLVAHCRPDEVECTAAMRSMYGCEVAYLHHGEAPHIVLEDH